MADTKQPAKKQGFQATERIEAPQGGPGRGPMGGGMVGQKAMDFVPSGKRLVGLLRPELSDRLLLGDARRDPPADQPGEDQVRAVAEDARSDRHQPDADDGEHHDQDGLGPLRRQLPDQPLR